MKKVINITIGKRIFWIEEDAYSHLQKYLEGIEKHFKTEDASGEIIEDIEYSISDKLSDIKNNQKDAVEYQDIEKVIGELGTIQELQEEQDIQTETLSSTIEDEEQTKVKKELYRNGDNKIIAGVASGIANYFGIDPVITRVLFFTSIFANGIGILFYIVLWIIVPQAKTASQKLAMKGEVTNLESIEKYFEEKTKKKITNSTLRNVVSFPVKIIECLFQIMKRIFPFFRVLIGIVLTFFTSVFIFIVSTLFFGFIGGGTIFDMDPTSAAVFQEILLISNFSFVMSAIFLIVFLPLFLLLLSGFALILKKKIMGLSVFLFVFITWMVSLSYLTINILQNTNTIENVARIVGEEIEYDMQDGHHIYFDVSSSN